ncbi:MAG: hypothetical protein A2Y10_01625 [Planctomycetes bacterium GWF2_41_51]|nr:MAG: hypothetical protein A2Y10_01625 [Planctomycetes bacterium GWF2_41_51]
MDYNRYCPHRQKTVAVTDNPIMKKYKILIALSIVNLCLGGIYAWSVFVPELVNNYGYTTARTQIVFGTTVCCLTLSMLFTGILENKIGPRPMVLICSALMFTGYFTASFSGSNFLILWLGCGVINGIAIGFGYVCMLAVSMRWFESKKGFACGMVIAGYGFGAIILSFAAQTLISHGWDVMRIFKILAIALGMIIFICALQIANPASHQKQNMIPTIAYKTIFRKPRFFILSITVGLGTFSGLMFIGNLKPIAYYFGYDSFIALLAIWLVSIGNAVGRIMGGVAYDRFKASTLKFILLIVAVSALFVVMGNISSIVFLIFLIPVGMSYGALLANIPAQVSEEFGHHNFGIVYPLVLVVHGLAALFAAPLAGFIYDNYHSYRPAMIIASCISFACFLGFTFAYRRQ